VLFLLGGAISLTGTVGVFQAWNWWLIYTSLKPLILQVFIGVLLTLAWISSAVVLWQRLPWAIHYCSSVVMITSIWLWVDRIFLTMNPLPFSRHVLSLVITCILLLFFFSSLYLVAPFMKPNLPTLKVGGNTSIQPTGDKNDKPSA